MLGVPKGKVEVEGGEVVVLEEAFGIGGPGRQTAQRNAGRNGYDGSEIATLAA